MGRVPEHLRQRHDRLDHLRTCAVLHAFDPPTARAQVAHDHAGVIFRRHHFDRHDRLEQNRRRPASGFLKRHRAGDLECHFVRVHVVIAAVVKRRFHIHHRIAGENTAFERFPNALIDRLDEFLGHRPARNIVDELVP